MIPRATLRLQFHRGFTFADAEALVPYFAQLGVSHLYASPIAVARPGSMHGYDVIDPTTVNPELGGEAALRSLAAALAAAGLGLIADIVPNHMAADPANAWWADVLRHGRASRYARFFDIDWEADPKVVLPILGKSLEETLAAGEIEVGREELRYFSHRLPLAPGEPGGLSDVLERQHYRLAWWRTAGDCINWRRFFDINELVSLRMDEPDGLRGGSCAAAQALRRGNYGRPAGRSRRRPRRSGRLLPDPSPTAGQGRLPRGREDPAARRDAARRLGLRRHHRLRLHERRERAAA